MRRTCPKRKEKGERGGGGEGELEADEREWWSWEGIV
jgi:hypothetical protein